MVDYSAEGHSQIGEIMYESCKMHPPLSKGSMCPNNSGIEEEEAESVDSGCVSDIGLSPETNWAQVTAALSYEYNFAESLLKHVDVKLKTDANIKTYIKLDDKPGKASPKKKILAKASNMKQDKPTTISFKSKNPASSIEDTCNEVPSTSKNNSGNVLLPKSLSNTLQDKPVKNKSSSKRKRNSEASTRRPAKKGRESNPVEVAAAEDKENDGKPNLAALHRELGQELSRLKKGKSGKLTPAQIRHSESKLKKKLKVLEKKRKQNEKKKRTAIELPATEQGKQIYNKCGKLVFSKFDFSNPVQTKYTDPKPKHDLNRALASVLKEKEKIKNLETKGQVEQAAKYMKNIAWNNALKKVSGEKVKDDVVRIRRAMQRKKIQKYKSKEKWEERNRSTQKAQDMRQEKRKRNIETRKQNKRQNKSKVKQKGKEGRAPGF